MNVEKNYGETIYMPNVQVIARLQFGEGNIGHEDNLLGPEDETSFGADLASCIQPITLEKTADCVDGRKTIALGDGTIDPVALERRVTHQLPGGLVLAVTKAGLAADLAVLRDAKSMQHAYEIMETFLAEFGYQDGGHVGCGASKLVEQSTAKRVDQSIVLATLPAINPVVDRTKENLQANVDRKNQLLQNGFFSAWSNTWHEDFLSQRVPQNFSTLATDPGPTNGHYEEGALLVRTPGFGFAKNRLASITGGRQVFAETTHTGLSLLKDIAQRIGGSQQERERFLLDFDDDPLQVLNNLAKSDLRVFAEAA